MLRTSRGFVCALLMAVSPLTAASQTFETLGTRAAGFGGAFVAVADDASAVYWNPAGLASGAFFSLMVDRSVLRVEADDPRIGSSRSSSVIALSTPPLGLSYYRLRRTSTSPLATATPDVSTGSAVSVDSLITHHVGVTLVQSLTDAVAVGATVKVVRGIAASGVATADRDTLLDADDLIGRAANTADADIGVMASLGILRAGLTVRNVRAPEFQSAGSGRPLELDRQVRAGIAFLPLQNVLMAIDVDLTRQTEAVGETRNVATGLEGRVHRRLTLRGGLRVNTIEASGRRPVLTGGGSFAILGSTFIDGHVTGGSDEGDRGWGVAGRVLF